MLGFFLFAAIMNIAAFAMMGMDKASAKKGAWRIPEQTLLLTAAFGGSLGAYAGMLFFHHKTRRWYFRQGLPSLIIVHACLLGIWAVSNLSQMLL